MPGFFKHYNLYFEHLPRNTQNEVSHGTMEIIKKLNFPISLFYDCYADIPSKDALQISVYMTREKEKHKLLREFFGNIVIYIFFDENIFISITEKQKQKEYILSSFESALYHIADIYEMPKENLEQMRKMIIGSDYVFQKKITEEIVSPDGKTKAHIIAKHDTETTNKLIYHTVFEGIEDNSIRRIMFANSSADKETMEEMIKSISWLENECLKICLCGGKDYFKIFKNTLAVEFFFQEAMTENARAQYNLARMYLSGDTVIKSKRDSLFWLRKSAEKGLPQAIEKLKEIESQD